MATPEGIVKRKVRNLLAEYQDIYTYWPVPSGFGKTQLDVLGCYRGRFFSVETKAEGKKPTLRQTEELKNIAQAMGETFVIAGPDDPVFDQLRAWLDLLSGTNNAPRIPQDQVRRHRI